VLFLRENAAILGATAMQCQKPDYLEQISRFDSGSVLFRKSAMQKICNKKIKTLGDSGTNSPIRRTKPATKLAFMFKGLTEMIRFRVVLAYGANGRIIFFWTLIAEKWNWPLDKGCKYPLSRSEAEHSRLGKMQPTIGPFKWK
jgi:hypothetical protein